KSALPQAMRVEKARPVEVVKVDRITTEAEAQEPPAVRALPRPTALPGLAAEPTLLEFIGKTILTVVIILVLAIVAALIFMVCLFGLTRRLGPRLGPLIHIEWTGPPALAGIPFGANSLGYAGALPQAMPIAPERYDRTGSE